jgi:hypothetical protein
MVNPTTDNRTALEILEAPIVAPTSPPAPQPSAALEQVAQEFAARIERYRTGGAA